MHAVVRGSTFAGLPQSRIQKSAYLDTLPDLSALPQPHPQATVTMVTKMSLKEAGFGNLSRPTRRRAMGQSSKACLPQRPSLLQAHLTSSAVSCGFSDSSLAALTCFGHLRRDSTGFERTGVLVEDQHHILLPRPFTAAPRTGHVAAGSGIYREIEVVVEAQEREGRESRDGRKR